MMCNYKLWYVLIRNARLTFWLNVTWSKFSVAERAPTKRDGANQMRAPSSAVSIYHAAQQSQQQSHAAETQCRLLHVLLPLLSASMMWRRRGGEEGDECVDEWASSRISIRKLLLTTGLYTVCLQCARICRHKGWSLQTDHSRKIE